MNTLFLVFLVLHGLLHLPGFLKGFGLKDFKELTLPVSTSFGLLWLAAALLFIAYGLLIATSSRYGWVMGFIAVAISQTLVVFFWSDAKFGTIPNAFILLVSLISFASYTMQQKVHSKTLNMIHNNALSTAKGIRSDDLLHLPGPVAKWMRTCGVVGKPAIRFGRVVQSAEMKLRPDQDKWLSAVAVQVTTLDTPAFIWAVEVNMNPFLFFKGIDCFENGKGSMLVKLNSLFKVVDEEGDKINEGTLQRYLGEMVWFPGLALSPFIVWEEIDAFTARATMSYKGTSGTGTFYFNSEGEVVKFFALRFKGNDPGAKRYGWEMNITGYRVFEGIKVPSEMVSTWKLDDKDWTWLKLKVMNLQFNKNPLN